MPMRNVMREPRATAHGTVTRAGRPASPGFNTTGSRAIMEYEARARERAWRGATSGSAWSVASRLEVGSHSRGRDNVSAPDSRTGRQVVQPITGAALGSEDSPANHADSSGWGHTFVPL